MSPPPLTTIFTPASSCTTDFYWITDTQSGRYYISLGPSDTADCFPTSFSSYSTDYYSPGYCPEGYTSVCASLNSVGSLTETVATCCPSGFSCQTAGIQPWFSTHGCTSIFPSDAFYTITSEGKTTVSYMTTGNGQGMNAHSVQVRWQNTDLEILKLLGSTVSSLPTAAATTTNGTETASASETGSSSSTSTSVSLPTNTASSTDTGLLSPSSTLSTGVKLAIAIPSAIIGLSLLLLVFWIFRRQRRKKLGRMQDNSPIAGELGPGRPAMTFGGELDATPRAWRGTKIGGQLDGAVLCEAP
ncbi:MAG: hypothetical protein M1834_009204 [Cirrosporium novae-zelandiae]|nr:MAG: hypothetical protein M1834_009204 [Cirrosporium novae-zelandiae]